MNNKDENLINKIVQLMERDESLEAPQDSIKWAKNLFLSRAAQPKKSLVKRVLAVMQVDLLPGKAAFGERSAAGSQKARQMLFEAGENSIDLRVSEGRKGFDLHGQILGAGFENCLIEVGEFRARTNELSEFSLKSIPPGDYSLTLQNKDSEIVIENIELK